MKKNLTISFIGGVAISVIALYFAFRDVPVADLFKYLASIDYFWVLPAVMTSIISFILRAFRWRIILESAKRISIWSAIHPLMIGFMINCVLPGRLGEVARPVVLQKKEKVPFPTGLATVVAERMFDIILLLLLFILTIGVLKIDPELNVAFGKYQLNRDTLQAVFNGMLKLGVILIAGIVLFSIHRLREFIYSVIRSTPKLFFFAGQRFKASYKKSVCEPVINILNNVAQGFILVRYPKKIIICFVYSMLIWGLQALSYYLFSLGSPGINLTYYEITAVMVIICFFIALPSAPGFWGLWEAGGVFALSLFGVSAKDAAGFTLANHAIQVIPVIIAGFASAMILSVNIRQLSYAGQEYRRQQPTVKPD
ncbi:MAG: flippase-like domain-containing protein [Desulfobacterales bacterium]|nr:MAG: flippase-like domain-containing protein [Desulfobacterales bacterium]